MGRRAHLRLAAAVPPAGPRLRTQARSPRGHGVLGHHHDYDKAPGQIRNRNSPGQTVGRRPQPSLTETRSTGRMTTFIYRLLERTLYNGLGLRTANRMRLAVGNDGSWRYWCLGWGCGTANKTVGRKPWEVDDGLWERIAQLLPVVKRNYGHPGRKRLDDRKVLCGILFVLCAGIR